MKTIFVFVLLSLFDRHLARAAPQNLFQDIGEFAGSAFGAAAGSFAREAFGGGNGFGDNFPGGFGHDFQGFGGNVEQIFDRF